VISDDSIRVLANDRWVTVPVAMLRGIRINHTRNLWGVIFELHDLSQPAALLADEPIEVIKARRARGFAVDASALARETGPAQHRELLARAGKRWRRFTSTTDHWEQGLLGELHMAQDDARAVAMHHLTSAGRPAPSPSMPLDELMAALNAYIEKT